MCLNLNRPTWLWLTLISLANIILGGIISVYSEAHWSPWHIVISILVALMWTVFLAIADVLAGALLLIGGWTLSGNRLVALIWAAIFVLVAATLKATDSMKSAGFSKTRILWHLVIFSSVGLGLGWIIGTVCFFSK